MLRPLARPLPRAAASHAARARAGRRRGRPGRGRARGGAPAGDPPRRSTALPGAGARSRALEGGRALLVAAAGVLALEALAVVAGGLLGALGVSLPPAVAGFLCATTALVLAPSRAATAAARALEPAHALLERYTGLIFVPYVVLLFTGGLPAGGELARMLGCCVASWLLVVAATATTVSVAEAALGGGTVEARNVGTEVPAEGDNGPAACEGVGAISLLDSVLNLSTCVFLSFLLGGPFLLLRAQSLVVPLRLIGTFAVYRAAQRMPSLGGGLFSTFISGCVVAVSLLAVGGTSAVQVYMRGAGAALLWLVTPSIVACSLSAYYARERIKKNIGPLLVGGFVGVPLAMASGAFLAGRVFGLPESVGLATLAKHNLSPFAVQIAFNLGVSPGLACTAAIVSGILGVCVLPWLLDRMHITSPMARGVAAGASSHGAGTLCLAARGEADASAFASTTFAFGGAIAVLLVNLAPFQIALRALAGYP